MLGHVEGKDDAYYVKACTRLVLEGKAPVSRPRKTSQNTLSADMCLLKVGPRDVYDGNKSKALGQRKANLVTSGTVCYKTRKKKEVTQTRVCLQKPNKLSDMYGAPFSHLFTELKISPIEVHISAIELEISPIQLKISAIELQISPNRPI